MLVGELDEWVNSPSPLNEETFKASPQEQQNLFTLKGDQLLTG